MATGIFRPDTATAAAQALAANARAGNISTNRPVNSVGLQQQLANVDWAGLARLANAPVTPTQTNYQGPQLRPGQGGINEIGSGGYAIGGFPSGQIGTEAQNAYNQMTRPSSTSTPASVVSNVATGGTGGTGGGTSGGGGAGGGGGMGAGAGAAAASNLWDDLLKQFEELRAAEEKRIADAGAALLASLQGRDPMSQFQWNPASIGIPQAAMANYVQAIGGSPGEVQATQQLGQELLNAFLGDVGQVAQGATTAEANWRARQQDVASQLTADAQRQLALNALAAQMGIKQAKTAEQIQREQDALKLALQYGAAQSSGSNLNVSAPNLPFQTVTIPGYGTITLPSTLV